MRVLWAVETMRLSRPNDKFGWLFSSALQRVVNQRVALYMTKGRL